MDKNKIKRVADLIRADLITINGGKNTNRTILIIMLIFFGVMGFLFSPLLGLYVLLLIGGMFVPTVFQNEMKYHSGKMFALLPIERKDLVRSRFIMCFAIYAVLGLAFYLLMMISLTFKPYVYLIASDPDEAESMDVIALLVRQMGGFSEQGLFSLIYFIVFAIGLTIMSCTLRKYFKDSKRFEAAFRGPVKTSKREMIAGLAAVGVILLLILIWGGIIKLEASVQMILSFIGQLILQLAQASDGFLLSAVVVTIALFEAIYSYVCTVLEYDEAEL